MTNADYYRGLAEDCLFALLTQKTFVLTEADTSMLPVFSLQARVRRYCVRSFTPSRQPGPHEILEYFGIAHRYDWRWPIAKGRPGAMPSDPWDKLPECSGSVHHLRG